MANKEHRYPRGSEWRQWDLHIHTPASFHWKGQRFDPTAVPDTDKELVDNMISALNKAEPAVFALMDYWTFDGWAKLKERLKQPDSPQLNKTVFPGIELRLVAPMNGRLNAHVIFSDTIEDQILEDFKSGLELAIINRPLSDDALRTLARKVGEDKLKHHGFNKARVDSDDKIALSAGSTIAEISCDSYRAAIEKIPKEKVVGFMPFDTNDGLADIKWEEHYSYCLGLFNSSPIFETRKVDTWGAFVGERTEGNAGWISSFQKALDNTPRLAVSGSDAHQFAGVVNDNDNRGYGDFPSGKATWIKADPTFRGLLQAIKEPAKRSFIGDFPPKLSEIDQNKTFFIDTIEVDKAADSTNNGLWLDGCKLQLNKDLVAIIGSKGSGKSALADVIALLGNSRQKTHFSFLRKDRFRGKSGEPAKHFNGKLIWCDSSSESRNLNDDPPEDSVELVRYIPQGHFEELCNAHISQRSNAFEIELRAAIFSHAGESVRLGALDFDQLIEQQESSFRDQLSEFRKDLNNLNQKISGIEDQLRPEVERSLEKQLLVKNRQIEEQKKIRPDSVSKPADELTGDQKDAASKLEENAEKLKSIDEQESAAITKESELAGKLKAVHKVQERMKLLERSYQRLRDDTAQDMKVLGLDITSLATLTINSQPLKRIEEAIPTQLEELRVGSVTSSKEKESLNENQLILKDKLNGPQLEYQKNLRAIEEWENKLSTLIGSSDNPETQAGIKARLEQLKALPQILSTAFVQRLKLSGEIFDILDSQRLAREQLFKPVQDLIQDNTLIREEYKLQFQATLGGSSDFISEKLFSIIKQNSGAFRGNDESYNTVRKIAEKYDFGKRGEILKFVTELNKAIVIAANGDVEGSVGIISILRKDKEAVDVYDMLFDLSFLKPRYSLVFQDTQIEQLSPGQRGALLLVFYLLVDKGRNPIILDQPEENLDNETVVSLLAPVLSEAKKKRQIIMVTHNPNLAVYCDAEQIIYSSFDRKNKSKITYMAGSVENPVTNARVVDVLEGTMPAFNNRRIKYY